MLYVRDVDIGEKQTELLPVAIRIAGAFVAVAAVR